MKLTVVGTGYVGLGTGACFAEMGKDVPCVDVDAGKIACLPRGGPTIHEPGLAEIVARNVAGGRLHFGTDLKEGVRFGTVQFIAVGTPPDEDGSADLQHVLAAARCIGQHMCDYKLVVDKRTLPVGTADAVPAGIAQALIDELLARGAQVLAHDPARQHWGALDGLRYAAQPMDAMDGADALVIVTEWRQFRSPDWDRVKALRAGPLVFDGRNLFDPVFLRGIGVEYRPIGRGGPSLPELVAGGKQAQRDTRDQRTARRDHAQAHPG